MIGEMAIWQDGKTHLQFSKNSGRSSMLISSRTLKTFIFFMVVMADWKSSAVSVHLMMVVMPWLCSKLSKGSHIKLMTGVN